MSNWVGISHYIYLYISFSEQLGGDFSLYILVYLFQRATGWGFLTIYTCISLSKSNRVGISHYIYLYISFSEQLGGDFSLYILVYLFQRATGWGFLTIYTCISLSKSNWVGISHYIYLYISFKEQHGGDFSLYILVYLFQRATGWGFLTIYTCISLSVSNWVGISHYIYILIVIYLLQSPPREMGVPQGSLLSVSLFSM